MPAKHRAEYHRRHRRENPLIYKRADLRARLKKEYGLTIDGWWSMLIAQAGRCAICAEPMRKPSVDHCHTTGKVRALLCQGCNIRVAAAESPWLQRTLDYIEHHHGR